MINIAIIEDDVVEAENLKNALERYRKEISEDIKINHFNSAEKILQNYKAVYDVIFMDIELPLMSGMDAAKVIRQVDDRVVIIFVTNMIKYAVQGYKVGALDYFVKPVSYYDLRLRMEQVRMALDNKIPIITIPLLDGVKSMLSSKIYYIEIMSHQITYHTTEGNFSISSKISLAKLEKDYSGFGFIRCSSSYLVNIDWCTQLKIDTVKVGNDDLKISRGMKKSFVNSLTKRLVKKW